MLRRSERHQAAAEDTPQSRGAQWASTGLKRSPPCGPTPPTEPPQVGRFTDCSPSVATEAARPAKAARHDREPEEECQECPQEGVDDVEELTRRLIAAQRGISACGGDRRRLVMLRDASRALVGACDTTVHEAATRDSWLMSLPSDVAIRLFSCCDAASLASLSCVCHSLGQNRRSSILGEAAAISVR